MAERQRLALWNRAAASWDVMNAKNATGDLAGAAVVVSSPTRRRTGSQAGHLRTRFSCTASRATVNADRLTLTYAPRVISGHGLDQLSDREYGRDNPGSPTEVRDTSGWPGLLQFEEELSGE